MIVGRRKLGTIRLVQEVHGDSVRNTNIPTLGFDGQKYRIVYNIVISL